MQFRKTLALAAILCGVPAFATIPQQARAQAENAQTVDQAEIAKNIRDLKSMDEKVRYDAVFALGEAGSAAASAAPDIIEMLKDTDTEVRSGAVLALGKLGKPAGAHIAKIAALLKDARGEVR